MSNLRKIVNIALILAALIIAISITNFTLVQSTKLVILSFIYLFLPGYTLSLFIFKEEDVIERVTFSVAISLVILPLPNLYASIYQSYIPTSIITAAIILCAIAALILRNGFWFGPQKKGKAYDNHR